MSDTPGYTSQDLRREAARYVGDGSSTLEILSSMSDRSPWYELPTDEFNKAFGQVVDLVTAADNADLTIWAVGIGAEGLLADTRHVDIEPEQLKVRIHFAFGPQVSDRLKTAVFDAIRTQATAILEGDGNPS